MSDSFETPRTVAARFLYSWDFPGENTGVGCHFLLQGIFLTQGSNSHLLHWQVESLALSQEALLCFREIKMKDHELRVLPNEQAGRLGGTRGGGNEAGSYLSTGRASWR